MRLKTARVAVFGIGGVGGYVAEALARSGVGSLELIDSDTICLSNLNRQIIATLPDLGRYKVDVMKERILSINPDAKVEARRCFFLPETAAELSDRIEMEKGFRLIPYHCVNGESVMKVFRVKKMCVHMEEDRWIENALVGIGEESLSGDREYEMILNPAIFSG